MFFKGSVRDRERLAKSVGWKDQDCRSLREAAHLAREQAKAEGLPLLKARAVDESWFVATMLETIPIYGTHASADRPQHIGASGRGLQLSADATRLLGKTEPGPVWRDIFVKREDFPRYLEWLRSHW